MKLYPDDWRGRLTTGVLVAATIIATKMFGPQLGIHGLWPEMLAVVVAIIVGNVLGLLLFRPPPGGPPGEGKEG